MKFKAIIIIKTALRYASRVFLREQKNAEFFKQDRKANRILVISLTHLGDMVLLSPFLGNLRINFPDAKIDILLKEQVSEILEYCPHIDNRIIYNARWVTSKKGDGFLKTFDTICRLKKNRYDLCFVTHPHIFSNMIAWLAKIPLRIGYSDKGDRFLNIYIERPREIQHARDVTLNLLKQLGLKIESNSLEIYLGKQDIAYAEDFFKDLSDISLIIGIHPGAGNRERIWLPERYAQVIKYLIQKYKAHILIFAAKQETDIVEAIMRFIADYQNRVYSLAGKTSVRQMASFMQRCDVLLANDAGPLHIASALGKPTVALFARTPDYWPKIWGPLAENSIVISGQGKGLARPEDIKAEDVIKALDELISKNTKL
jgi:lipopolysaccharide heptosyltransferase II